MSKLPVVELYSALQAEGKYTGIPHIIIRTTGCPMRCSFGDSICDSWYTSWLPEKGKITEEQIYEFYEKNNHIRYTMITGGEPTNNEDILNTLIKIAKGFNHFITIETAGIKFVQTDADFISVSPKLRSSVPKLYSMQVLNNKKIIVTEDMIKRHELYRKDYFQTLQMIFSHPDYQIKPVVSNIENDIKEIELLLKRLNVPKNKVYLMPAGSTSEELKLIRKDLMEYCIKEGYNYTDRIHIVAYENQRGV